MKIALDFHDVTVEFARAWLAHANEERGTSHTPEDIAGWRAYESLDMTKEDFRRYIAQVHKTPGNSGLMPNLGAVRGIRALASKHELSMVSGTHDGDGIRRWLEAWGLPALPVVTVNPTNPGKFSLDYNVFIDDNPNMIDKAPRGKTLIVYSQPWNDAASLGPRDLRAQRWESIPRLVGGIR